MMKLVRKRVAKVVKAKVQNLAQQKIDFTAEGAPPPGKVAGEGPATADTAAPLRARRPSRPPASARR